MSTPNTCEVCDVEYRVSEGHTCKVDDLRELVDELRDELAAARGDSERLDWLDEDVENVEDLLDHMHYSAHAENDEEIRDAIDGLMGAESEPEEP